MRNFDWVLPASDTRQSSIIVLCVLLFRRTWRVSTGGELEDLDTWGIRWPSCPVFLQLVLEGHKHPPWGNLGEGKCIASSVSQISLAQSPWSCFPVKSWSTISKQSLQSCLLASKRKRILSSGETLNTSVFWKFSCTWRNKLIFWKTNKQINQWQKGKMFGFCKKLLVVKRWLFHKNIDAFSSISVPEMSSHQLQTSQHVCTWCRFSMQQKLWLKEHPKWNKDT